MSPELWPLFKKETNIQLVGTLFHPHKRKFLVTYEINFDLSHNQVTYEINNQVEYLISPFGSAVVEILDSRPRVQASPASLRCVLEHDTFILA